MPPSSCLLLCMCVCLSEPQEWPLTFKKDVVMPDDNCNFRLLSTHVSLRPPNGCKREPLPGDAEVTRDHIGRVRQSHIGDEALWTLEVRPFQGSLSWPTNWKLSTILYSTIRYTIYCKQNAYILYTILYTILYYQLYYTIWYGTPNPGLPIARGDELVEERLESVVAVCVASHGTCTARVARRLRSTISTILGSADCRKHSHIL